MRKIYRVKIPANVYNGRNIIFSAVYIWAYASSKKAIYGIIENHEIDILYFLEKRCRRFMSEGVLYLPKPLLYNVFFTGPLYFDQKDIASGKVITKDGWKNYNSNSIKYLTDYIF